MLAKVVKHAENGLCSCGRVGHVSIPGQQHICIRFVSPGFRLRRRRSAGGLIRQDRHRHLLCRVKWAWRAKKCNNVTKVLDM